MSSVSGKKKVVRKTTRKKTQNKKKSENTQKESLAVGGQAVIEGVMMRDGPRLATAVRRPDGNIKIKIDKYKSSTKNKILGLPFIRGIVNMIEIMILGMKIMIWSSNQQLEEEEEFSTKELIWTILVSVLLSVAIFKFLPLLLATLLQKQTGSGNFVFNLADGLIKISFLVFYMWIIGRLADVKRLYQYHGAEHKTINCYESQKKLTIKNVMASTRFHPRCGTTFIIFVLLFSVFIYLLIPLNVSFWGKLGLRLLFLPFIAGISYELIKFGGKHHEHPIMKIILWPGLRLQRITTSEPDAKQVEVAIASLQAATGKKKAKKKTIAVKRTPPKTKNQRASPKS